MAELAKLKKWVEFKSTFDSTIHRKENLSKVDKLNYLKSLLKGEALSIISSISVTEEGYDLAYNLLINEYENSLLIINSHIKSLLELPTLKSLKVPVDNWDLILIYIIVQKLDNISRQEWELQLDRKNIPKLNNLLEFLEHRAKAFQILSLDSVNKLKNDNNKKQISLPLNTDTTKRCCFYCKLNNHDRREFVAKNRLCFLCLNEHSIYNCRSKMKCRICNKRHNDMLHYENANTSLEVLDNKDHNSQYKKGDKLNISKENLNKNNGEQVSCCSNQNIKSNTHETLLPTVKLKIFGKDGKYLIVRALLDSASESNFLRQTIVDRLGLCKQRQNLNIEGLSGHKVQVTESVNIKIHSLHSSFNADIECFVLDNITLTTVTYGATSSPYLAIKVLHKLAEENENCFPKAAKVITRDFYMDDCLTGANSAQELLNLKDNIVSILESAGFECHKWVSNCKELLNTIPLEKQEKCLNNYESDKLKIWTFKDLNWDTPLPTKLHNEFISNFSDIQLLNKVKIPRHYFHNYVLIKSHTLHGFCDSSKYAYGACVYIRSLYEDGSVTTNLIASKTKLVPLKGTTLPRNSSIIYGWIKSDPSKLKMFVSNRVFSIQELTNSLNWYHLNSEYNSCADKLSRGLSVSEFLNFQNVWFHGPEWLTLEKTHWPKSNINLSKLTLHETKDEVITVLFTKIENNNIFYDIINSTSDYMKLFRAKGQQQLMADLPKERVNLSRHFLETGIDFGGPVLVKQSLLIKEDGVPPLKWILARISKLIKDKNNIARSAIVKTQKGEFTRSITKL
ncbi:uncharacterized protein LOC123302298 [Chrysoperla carnea]|uniref:uncharacterized protein LOC123302298 n=1 Tax=Chrysoperla carnea TaxID=189513 RepID=UPI001D086DA8|nr:uncharacterized protein LOC123302298 [Chrysoperla carnea]